MSSVCDMYKENPKKYTVHIECTPEEEEKTEKKSLVKKMLMYM